MNIHFKHLYNRPLWQRFLIFAVSVFLMISLFWIGMVFIISFAVIAFSLAIVNKIKMKITGRPLFSGPKHFHRYQSQFRQNDVIEGEVVDRDNHKD